MTQGGQTADANNLSALIDLSQSMVSGEWRPVGLNSFSDVVVTRALHNQIVAETGSAPFWGATGPASVFGAWSGSAFDPVENRMFFMGGGHNDYGGNEIYQFDLDTLTWTRLTDPAPLLKPEFAIRGNPESVVVHQPVGSPNSPHTYDGLVWNESTGTLWLTNTGAGFGPPHNPETTAVWEFNPDTREWTAHDATINGKRATTAYLSETDEILIIHHLAGGWNNPAFLYDENGVETSLGVIGGEIRKVGDSLVSNLFQNTVTGEIYEAHAGAIWKFEFVDGALTSTRVVEYPDLGLNFAYHQAGYQYNPNDGKFYIWNGGQTVITWDPSDNEFEVVWNETQGVAPDPNAGGTGRIFDKWLYVPEADLFVGIANGSDGIWAWKPGQNPPTINQAEIGEAEVDPATAHSLSFFVPLISGDKNYDSSLQISYRKEGESEWHEGLDLLRIRPELVRISYDFEETGEGFAGSLFGLDPGTQYEIRLEAVDPDGAIGQTEQTITTSTVEVPSSTPANTAAVKVSNMEELQLAAEQAGPGTVILIEPGLYQGQLVIDRDGTAENPIVIRGLDRGSTLLDGQGEGYAVWIQGDHVHFEDLSVINAGTGILVRGETEGVTVRGNLISQVNSGIDAKSGHKNLLIEDNVLEGRVEFPDTSSNTWNYEGIVVSGQGIEIAYNTVSGFGDSLGLSQHSTLENIGIDIHHNLVLWGGDDGIELDFALRNVQAHHNLIANTANGISFQPVWGGPAYAYNNVLLNLERGPFKIKAELDPASGIFILNNTSIKSGEAWIDFSGPDNNLRILNNLFVGGEETQYVLLNESVVGLAQLDYNAWSRDGVFKFGSFRESSFSEWQANSPYSDHGVLLDGQAVFGQLDPDAPLRNFSEYHEPLGLNFALNPSSSAVDAGLVLRGINDDFTGAGPDIGAWELGQAAPQYGARVTTLPAREPIALPDEFVVEVDTGPVVFDVVANDVDPNGDPLSLLGVGAATNGAVSQNGDGTVSYDPTPGFIGEDSFTYTISDGTGETSSATVRVTVAPPNDSPTASDDQGTTVEADTLILTFEHLLGNDSDPNDDSLFIVAVTQPARGTAQLLPASVIYTPEPGFAGSDSFFYTVADGRGGTDRAQVTVTVLSDGSVIGTEQRDVIDLSESDVPTTVLGNGGRDQITGTQAGDEIVGGAGADSIDGGPGDDLFLVEGSDGGHDVLNGGDGNDTLRGGSDDDVFAFFGAVRSIEVIDGGGGDDAIVGHHGRDLFDFSNTTITGVALIDGREGPDLIIGSEAGDVIAGGAGQDSIDGGPGDDVFRVEGIGDGHDILNGGDGLDVLRGSDADDVFGVFGEISSIEVIDGRGGRDTILGHYGRDVLDFSNSELIDVEMIDGAGGPDIIIGSKAADLIAGGAGQDNLEGGAGDDLFLVEGSDGGHDEIKGGDGIDTLKGSSGDDVIGLWRSIESVEVIDGAGGFDILLGHYGRDILDFSSTELRDIALIDGAGGSDTIIGSAGDDTIRGGLGQNVIDGGPGADVASYDDVIANFNITSHGGVIEIRHVDAAKIGDRLLNIETLQFADARLVDGVVIEENAAPLLLQDEATTDEDQAVTLDVLANDRDPDGDQLSIVSAGPAMLGSVSINEDGTLTYLPDRNVSGLDEFKYIVTDGFVTRTSVVRVTIASGNDAPIAVDDNVSLVGRGSVTIDAIQNDLDPDGDAIEVVAWEDGQFGSVVRNPDGTLTYLLQDDSLEADSFTYTISDGDRTDTAIVSISIEPSIIVDGGPSRDVFDLSDEANSHIVFARAGSDIVIGSALGDVIVGGEGHDQILGGAGDDLFLVEGDGEGFDVFNGGAGWDTLRGSEGDDKFGIWGSIASIEIIDGLGGENVVLGHQGRDILDFSNTSLLGIDAISGADGPDILIGSAADDVLIGGAGQDRIDGGSGNDTFLVTADGDGHDVFDGGDGDDVLRGSVGDDVIGLWATIASVERIEGLSGIDTLLGHYGRDILDFSNTTLIDVEVIDGSGGADVLIGSAADDVIVGGAGQDRVSGGAGNDVFLVAGDGQGFDSFDGGLGLDTLRGSEGDDVFGLWSGLTSVEYIEGRGGDDVILGHYGRDVLDFTDVTISGVGLIDGAGGPDVIHGTGSDDRIIGGGGQDTIFGGGGNDTLLVRGTTSGFDVFDGGAGDDSLVGSDADDIFGVFVELSSIEFIDGLDGSDVVLGHGGSDFIDLSASDLRGVELIDGGGGHDTILGSRGVDRITGGAGQDVLSGRDAGDIFLFLRAHSGESVDIIVDFNRLEGDKIDISDLLVGVDFTADAIGEVVRLTSDSQGMTLSVDLDGANQGFGFTEIVNLENVIGLSVQQLFDEGALIT